MRILNKIALVFKETAFYIAFIIYIVLIFLSFGLIFLVFDYVKQKNENDDWTLMEEWERKETKKAIKKLKKEEKRK